MATDIIVANNKLCVFQVVVAVKSLWRTSGQIAGTVDDMTVLVIGGGFPVRRLQVIFTVNVAASPVKHSKMYQDHCFSICIHLTFSVCVAPQSCLPLAV